MIHCTKKIQIPVYLILGVDRDDDAMAIQQVVISRLLCQCDFSIGVENYIDIFSKLFYIEFKLNYDNDLDRALQSRKILST